MNGYLSIIIGSTICAKILKFTLPKGNPISKYLFIFLNLCITASLILPIVEVINLVSELEIPKYEESAIENDYSEIFEEEISEILYPSVEEYISKTLYEKFHINNENCEIFIRFNTSGDVISLEQILIFLKGEAVFADTGAISLYFEERFLCPIDVSVDIP